ncbi:sigma-54-dependent Fis family transcriptional regulator [Oceanobacillus sp. CFH 90083]|uniref:sigma-54-dependent Fis family transcriptional regulator n=1 Tax=Oceanobacillus sp. CFH 90083 TaxID=2592336 RepID=UPI001883AE14|nr:sigma-54-dependent Fis family transcriptional regulator [Oceanobacillus sp. CFH 90083]
MLHFHIIAPYQAMIPIIEECQQMFSDINITYSVGDLQEGVKAAVQKENEAVDIFISRGGTARILKEHVTIPVVDIHLSGYDLTRSLTLASQIQEKTAVVGFSNITTGASSIIELLNLPLKVFTVTRSEEVAPLLLHLKEEGYYHILGDVITVKTSEAIGLRGMLLQSGKESIIRAIEEAAFLAEQLQKQTHLKTLFEELLVTEHRNIIVFNQFNEVVYKHFEDFADNPLSQQDWYVLNSSMQSEKHRLTKYYPYGEEQIRITGYRGKEQFKLYFLEKYSLNRLQEQGIRLKSELQKEPVASQSEQIKKHMKTMIALYKKNKPILITGEKGTGKKFLATQVHINIAPNDLVMEIDAALCNMKKANDLFSLKPKCLILYNVIPDQEMLGWIRDIKNLCEQNNVQLFITSEHSWPHETVEHEKLHQIHLPKLVERIEDLQELAVYFLADYHQKYGTTAMKISEEALAYLKGLSYQNHVDSLRDLMKQATLNEKDYILHKKTLATVSEQSQLPQTFPINGTLKEMEATIIAQVLREEDNNQTKAAKRLGINRATLWRKLKE